MHFADLSLDQWMVLIGVIVGGCVTIINAIGSWWGHKTAQVSRDRLASSAEATHDKLDVIKTQTNGRYDAIMRRLDDAHAQIATLRDQVATLTIRRETDKGNT